jgi:hypothetical protein
MADELISKLREQGINDDRICLTNDQASGGLQCRSAAFLIISALRKKYPRSYNLRLSYISFGLPERKYLIGHSASSNAMGLDSAIMNL